MSALLDKIGSSFFVASFIPAAGFIIVSTFLFAPVMPSRVLQFQLSGVVEPMNLSFLSLLALAIILGFTLSSLSPFTFKLFQGYYLLEHFDWLKRRQREKALKSWLDIQRCDTMINQLIHRLDKADFEGVRKLQDHLEKLHLHRYNLAAHCSRQYPPMPAMAEVMPTQFGNVMLAAEIYPKIQYGIEKVTLWPRLLRVISKDYFNKLEQSENIVFFSINSALLTLFIALASLLVALHQLVLYRYASLGLTSAIPLISPNNQLADIYGVLTLRYSIAFIVGMALSYGLYRVATLNVEMFANLVRGAFDLFRRDLLLQLHFALPSDEAEEYRLWTDISSYMTLAQYDNQRFGPFEFSDRAVSVGDEADEYKDQTEDV